MIRTKKNEASQHYCHEDRDVCESGSIVKKITSRTLRYCSLRSGDKECIQNFGWEIFCKVTMWKVEEENRG
jgi:hypothetical protein